MSGLSIVRRLWADEEGQGMVEYALIIALIAIALIAGLGLLQGSIEGVFTQIQGGLSGGA